jgi:hypothetical protein
LAYGRLLRGSGQLIGIEADQEQIGAGEVVSDAQQRPPATEATAQAQQSPKFRAAGCLPLPNRE